MQQAAPAAPEQVQAELQQLLSEFYSGAGGAERKAEIDQLLGNFKRQPDSWVHCQQFLGQTPQLVPTADGQYVLFFSVLVFEEFVKRYWAEAPSSQKDPIRTFLFQCLAAHHAVLPPFLCTKLAKVNVDIAKRDWPHDYPDFLTRLTAALGGDDASAKPTALLLLQLVAEEFVSTQQDVLAARQVQIKQLLTAQLNSLLGSLFGLLEAAAGSDPRLCGATLTTLSQFFSWVPLSQHITPPRLGALCACSISQARTGELGLQALESLNELLSKNYVPAEFGDFLLVCFNHILALLDMIVADEATGELDADYIDRAIQFTLNFFTNHLRRVEGEVREGEGFNMSRMLTALFQVTYGRKTACAAELIRGAECWDFFVEYVIAHREESAGLAGRYQAGLLMVMEGAVTRLLHAHNPDMLQELLDEEGAECGGGLGDDRLEESLGGGDDDEDDGEASALPSERSQFSRCSLDLLSNLAVLFPMEVLQSAFGHWQQLAGRWIAAFGEAGVGSAEGGPVRGGGEIGERLAWVARDACVVLQLWAALIEPLLTDFEGRFEFGCTVVASLLEFGEYSAAHGAVVEGLCGEAAVLCHAQLYSTLSALGPWLSAVLASIPPVAFGPASGMGPHADLARQVLDKMLTIAVAALDPERPPLVSAAAARLLQTLCGIVRPPGLREAPQFQALLERSSAGPDLSLGCQLAASQPHGLSPFLLAAAVSNGLLLASSPPARQRTAAEMTAAGEAHKAYVSTFVTPFAQVVAAPSFVECAEGSGESIRYTVRCLAAMIEGVDAEPNAVKLMMYDSVAPALSGALCCLQVYASTPHVVRPVAELLGAVARTLRSALSKRYPTFIDDTIGVFLRICEGDSVAALCQGPQGQPSVLGNFLALLSSLTADRGALSASLLPDIIDLCLTRLHPVLIVQADCPEELQRAFFGLVHGMLLHHWNHFVPSAIGSARPVVASAPQHFLQLLQTIGGCFESVRTRIPCHPSLPSSSQRKRSLRQEAASPALYGFNLAGLEALDASRQLYQRKEFAALRLSFLQTLFKTLLRRSHTLLQDEIIVTIHSIVSVDFDHFHQQFLFPFLTEATVLADPQKQALIDGFSTERDLPTFKTNVQARATTHPGTLLAARWRRFADTPAGLRRAGLRARLLLLRLPGRRGRLGAQLSGAGWAGCGCAMDTHVAAALRALPCLLQGPPVPFSFIATTLPQDSFLCLVSCMVRPTRSCCSFGPFLSPRLELS